MRRAHPWKALPGRWLLCAYFAAGEDGSRLSQRDVAKALGTTEQVIHSWKSGARRPNPDHADALERLVGVPRDKWRTRAELAKLGKLRSIGAHLEQGQSAGSAAVSRGN